MLIYKIFQVERRNRFNILRDRARPYVLRRTKEDMLKELPDVFERKQRFR